MLTAKKENSGVKRRSKGEQTKHLILEATIKVLAINGLKGTTHRAIAKQADIQLSLTTYYFKDIEELVAQAILLNIENMASEPDPLWLTLFSLLEAQSKTELRKRTVKSSFAKEISEILTQHIMHATDKYSAELSVEQILYTHTHIYESFIKMAEKLKTASIEPYYQLARFFNKNSPEVDADILFTHVNHIKYQCLTYPNNNSSQATIYTQVSRLIHLLLNIKQ